MLLGSLDVVLNHSHALTEFCETIQDLLARQYEGARVDEARQGALVQIVDPAVVPDRPVNLYRVWILLAVVFCSLPLALLTAAFAEGIAILRRSFRESSSWTAALEQVVVGVLR